MSMTAIVDLAGIGATVVLYVLIALSALQLALIVERAIVFVRSRGALAKKVVAVGEANAYRGPAAAGELMKAAVIEDKLAAERGLAVLGTLGNNAPFIGLFGTVLGIIHTVAGMSQSGSAQASREVMGGISEALIATAVGLMVALPAVAAFNAFSRALKTRALAAEAAASELLARIQTTTDIVSITKKAA